MSATGHIHAGDPERSRRMQRVLAILAAGLAHSSMELTRRGRQCAAHSTIAELRARGYRIPRAVRVDGIYYYRLEA